MPKKMVDTLQDVIMEKTGGDGSRPASTPSFGKLGDLAVAGARKGIKKGKAIVARGAAETLI